MRSSEAGNNCTHSDCHSRTVQLVFKNCCLLYTPSPGVDSAAVTAIASAISTPSKMGIGNLPAEKRFVLASSCKTSTAFARAGQQALHTFWRRWPTAAKGCTSSSSRPSGKAPKVEPRVAIGVQNAGGFWLLSLGIAQDKQRYGRQSPQQKLWRSVQVQRNLTNMIHSYLHAQAD